MSSTCTTVSSLRCGGWSTRSQPASCAGETTGRVTVSSLHRKLARDLWQMKGQALAISVVIASGVATLVMSLAMLGSLRDTLTTYYANHRFADVFALMKASAGAGSGPDARDPRRQRRRDARRSSRAPRGRGLRRPRNRAARVAAPTTASR